MQKLINLNLQFGINIHIILIIPSDHPIEHNKPQLHILIILCQVAELLAERADIVG